jgi:hypothetical protein
MDTLHVLALQTLCLSLFTYVHVFLLLGGGHQLCDQLHDQRHKASVLQPFVCSKPRQQVAEVIFFFLI